MTEEKQPLFDEDVDLHDPYELGHAIMLAAMRDHGQYGFSAQTTSMLQAAGLLMISGIMAQAATDAFEEPNGP